MTDISGVDSGGLSHKAPDTARNGLGLLLRRNAIRLTKFALGLLLVAVGARVLLIRLIFKVSTHAVIGANVRTTRAPIDGLLSSKAHQVGDIVEADETLGTINNKWVDSAVVRELTERLSALDAEIASLTPLMNSLATMQSGLKLSASLYQRQRIASLETVLRGAEAQLRVERAREEEASERAKRTESMEGAGVSSVQQRSEADRDSTVATQQVAAATENIARAHEELTAAAGGVNVDAYSDRPYSAQKLDEIHAELARWQRQLEERLRVRQAVQDELTSAKAEFERLTTARLVAPRRARIWSVSAAPDGFVQKGGPIVSMLDCADTFAVAAVSERTFNLIRIGGPAYFKFSSTSEILNGAVTQLLGANHQELGALMAPGLLGDTAATQGKDDDGAYLVVVALSPGHTRARDACTLGQSGEVSFE